MMNMKLLNSYRYEVKKSVFIAYYYDLTTLDEAKQILKGLKEEHKKARHIPYAYKLTNTASKSDDKEPNGTAGNPIFNIIVMNNLENKLIAVVRYFGGTKLGAGGLLRAYSTAASNVIKKEKLC